MEAKTQARVEQKAGDESCSLARAVVPQRASFNAAGAPKVKSERVLHQADKVEGRPLGPALRPAQPLVHPAALIFGYSTQSNVRVTAFFQNRYSLSRSAASILGVHSLSLPQLARRSSTSFQNPTARPAAYAAPSDVVSATVGRMTGTPRTSAWNCIRRSLNTMPPSTFKDVSS